MKISCLIVDDEPLAIDLIERHISLFDDLVVAGKCRNVREALKILRATPVDLVFLDVQMPEIDGISFLSEMKSIPPVILTTAHREHALQAYEQGVIDYLLKPISILRFTRAIERFKAFYGDNAARHTASAEYVSFKSGLEFQKAKISEIQYIRSQKDYVNIVTASKKILVRASMKNILLQLPQKEFIQIHKSYIVPIAAITSITANSVCLNGLTLPIGQSYKMAVKALML